MGDRMTWGEGDVDVIEPQRCEVCDTSDGPMFYMGTIDGKDAYACRAHVDDVDALVDEEIEKDDDD